MNIRPTSTSTGSRTLASARLLAGLLALLALLGACSTTRPPPPQNEAQVREFAAKGYASVEHVAVATSAHAWLLAGQVVKLALSEPQGQVAVPLVIYLPGLGEASDAGAKWRAAWAAAGYAVLSVQPLDEDASAWASELARSGEFRALGRERYAAVALQRRLQRLQIVVDEARRRAATGESMWQRIDWSRAAVAGFDLGAYTAMVLAGEQVTGVDAGAGRLAIRAAVALSPFASLAAGALDTRYRDIRMPVLSVTSDADGDVLGLVDSAQTRRAPYEAMPGPDKFLLTLQGVPHAGFSGGPGGAALRSTGGDAMAQQESGSRRDGEGGSQQRRGGKQRAAGDSGGSRAAAPTAGVDAASRGLSGAALEMRIVAMQDISTAFLDGYLKDDRLAREWLAGDAARWLGTSGSLRRK